jgi:hypothetical protein
VSPDQTKEMGRRSRGAVRKTPHHGFAHDGRGRKVLEPDAIEDVLRGRQILDQCLGGKVGLGQRVDEYGVPDVLEAVAGRDFDEHARGPVCARPDHAGVDRHIARLHTVGDHGTIVRAAEVRFAQAAHRGERRGRGRPCQEPAPSQSVDVHEPTPLGLQRRTSAALSNLA